ncbi:ABC transporter ATP-binding protein [Arthrobacter sp. 08Y14]|uniref:ABC transporter ATP-binding protein n=1 Tax=Arthrobacter sp. 08Y14 TaxID=2058885 RepID=UPI000CE363BC|nr:ABC transporter ATP-binding protein [Arthrobacter sp. 08Y14]
MNVAPALSIRGLSKSFGGKIAVNSVDLEVLSGSFFGLVGPNGAGKTTLLLMAVGLMRPDAGTSAVLGTNVWHRRLQPKRDLGVLPDALALPEFLTGRELLNYLGRLRGLEAEVVDTRAEELLQVMDLLGEERTLVVDYSTGMRKKIGLATALLHNPRVLVLDEPFEAVDPVSALSLKRILGRYVARGGAVLLSSHVMALVEQLCDTVAVMSNGEVIAGGALEEVRGAGSLENAVVALTDPGSGGAEELSWLGN